jgi:phenylalanine-4-hydroxylase
MTVTTYIAKKPGQDGKIHYNKEENSTWQQLITHQLKIIENRACDEFLQGLEILDFPKDRIPQLEEVNKKLEKATGWNVEAVPALINFEHFFNLLATRKFPAATFIRRQNELDYLQEPDIFHELFGHCPMLTDPVCANFMQRYGELGVGASRLNRAMLARLYWFTIEFGLIETSKGARIYGGGILSSISETSYALESNKPVRKPFNLLEILRTPYRIDIMQSVYFMINSYNELYDLVNQELFSTMKQARELGMLKANFPPKKMGISNINQTRWQLANDDCQAI